jgi:hypothetical protein
MVDMGFLLGLLTAETCKIMKTIARVRNTFAHDWKFTTFEDLQNSQDKRVREVLKDLNALSIFSSETDTHRATYIFVVGRIISTLIGFSKRVKRVRRKELIPTPENMEGLKFVKDFLVIKLKADGIIPINARKIKVKATSKKLDEK